MAKDAKDGFERLVDLALPPETVEKHGRPMVAAMAIEEYTRLREIAGSLSRAAKPAKTGKETQQT